jgi:hypothetical protein
MQKKILSAKERRERKCGKDFTLASAQGKKSERKCRKRFSLLRSGEKESAEKDFFPCECARKKE